MSKVKQRLTVYLAGGITGLTKEEAFTWRNEVTHKLELLGIKCYNPLKKSDYNMYSDKDNKFTSGDKICYLRDRFMVAKSDIILINLNSGPTSIGTLIEKGWVDLNTDKLIIVVSEKELTHPFIVENAIILPTMESALGIIMELQ